MIFIVSRAAAPEGTGGESVLYGDLLDIITALPDTFQVGNKSRSSALAAWLEILEKEVEASDAWFKASEAWLWDACSFAWAFLGLDLGS